MAVRVGIGLARYPFEDPGALRAWLDRCEASRIDSIWQSDQVLTPAATPEPIGLLAVIAGATQRLKIGTNAIVLGFRDPITFARQCATLDFLSGGRFLPVVGVGNAGLPAWKAAGRDPRGRGARANEALEIATRLWAEESVTFAGEHYRVEGASLALKPIQQPLPLWIGGSSEAAIRRTVRYGNGWLAGLQTVDEAIQTAAAIREHAAANGGSIPDDHYGATVLFRIETRSAAAREPDSPRVAALAVTGAAERLVERIRDYVAGGITKFVAIPAVNDAAAFLEQTELLDREVIPTVSELATGTAAAPRGALAAGLD